MKEPDPLEFGIDLAAVERCEASRQSLGWKVIPVCCVLAGVAVAIVIGRVEKGAAAGIFYAVLLSPVYVAATAFVLWQCLRVCCDLNPEEYGDSSAMLNFRRYKQARAEYAAWAVRQKRDFWTSLNGRQFEAQLAAVFQRAGYRTTLTPASGDQGIDIYLEDGEQRIGVQCKAHKRPLGPGPTREFYGSLVAQGCRRGLLVCLGGFTQGARDFCVGKPVELWDLHHVMLASADAQSLKGYFSGLQASARDDVLPRNTRSS